MMYKKKKGFSLAELLISLLVISIVLAAAIPTITKRNSAGSEKIWHWAGANNSIYSAIGANQSVMIGANQMPHREQISNGNYYGLFFRDNEITIPSSSGSRPFFTTDGDKLVLLKRSLGGNNQTDNFSNSHISFYNLENSSSATTKDITYAGRIATDEHNLAFGIGSLQQLHTADTTDVGFKGYNTALGHYSLFYNTEGERNTAVGEKTLTYNLTGSNNTALGYNALRAVTGSNNTSVGTNSMPNITAGRDNTAVGTNTLRLLTDEGSYNTAIGSRACEHVVGDYNICIGYMAGTAQNKLEDDNYLVIGNDPEGAPIVEGHTSFLTDGTKEKNFNVNTRYFNVQPYDASTPIFQVIANSGTSGYEDGAKYGDFRFSLKDVLGAGDSLQLRMTGTAEGTNREAKIIALDPYAETDDTKYAKFNINDLLFLTMPDSSGDDYVGIKTADNKILGLQKSLFIEDGTNFKMDLKKTDGFSLVENSSSGLKSSIAMNDGEVSIWGNTLKIVADDDVSFNAANGVNLSEGVFVDSSDVYITDLPTKVSAYVATATSTSVSDVIAAVAQKAKEAYDAAQRAVTLSDARLKNISGDNTAGLKEINALEVKNYTYKNDKEKTPHVGVIAQQLQKIFPNSVIKGDDGYLRIKTEEIFYAMVNSIKELFTQIQDLTAKITGLDKRITELEEQNKALKKQNEEFEKRLAKLEKQTAK